MPGKVEKASQRRKHFSWVSTRVSRSSLLTKCHHSSFFLSRVLTVRVCTQKIEPSGAKFLLIQNV